MTSINDRIIALHGIIFVYKLKFNGKCPKLSAENHTSRYLYLEHRETKFLGMTYNNMIQFL